MLGLLSLTVPNKEVLKSGTFIAKTIE